MSQTDGLQQSFQGQLFWWKSSHCSEQRPQECEEVDLATEVTELKYSFKENIIEELKTQIIDEISVSPQGPLGKLLKEITDAKILNKNVRNESCL